MMDPYTKEAIEIGSEIAGGIIKSAFEGVTGWFKDKNKERDFFGIATRRYAKNLIERYNYVKVLGMSRPVPLKSLYVRANILEKITSQRRLSVDEMEKLYDRDRRSFGKTVETKEGEKIVNELQRFIVLGKPGAGKTTFLKYVALQMLDKDSQIKEKRLPVFVTLKEFADSQTDLMDYIVQEFDTCGFEDAEAFVERMLEKGKCILLLDGLDEVSQENNRDGVIKEIIDFSDKYGENQFIVSCRVAAYNHWFGRFTDVEIADFNDEQIEAFIKNWFSDEPEVAETCWDKLKNNKQLRELATIPLLLTLLCIAYDENNNFPPNRAELYKEALSELLKIWDSSRRINRDKVYKSLSLNQKKSLFARIAIYTFENDQYFIPQRILDKQIQNFLLDLSDVKEEEKMDLDSEIILKTIEAQHGIFVQRAKGVYSFLHLSFQEYFASKYIVDNLRQGTLERLVNNFLFEEKWREVFLSTTELLNQADAFFSLMAKAVNNQSLTASTIRILFDVEQFIGETDSNFPKATRRAYALYLLALSNLLTSIVKGTYDFNKVYIDFFNLTHSLVRNLTKNISHNLRYLSSEDFDSLILISVDSNGEASALSVPFKRGILVSMGNPLDLDFDWTEMKDSDLLRLIGDLSEIGLDENMMFSFLKSEDNSINALCGETIQYLNGVKRIVECLQTDCFVSPNLRQRLMDELLAVPEEMK